MNPDEGKSDPEDMVHKIYLAYREYVEHENALVNHRTNWFIATQGFLVAAFGLTLQAIFFGQAILEKSGQLVNILAKMPRGPSSTSVVSGVNKYDMGLILLAFLGFITSVLAGLSIRAAVVAIKNLNSVWISKAPTIQKRWSGTSDLLEALPPITGAGDPWASLWGHCSGRFLPALFAAVWGALGVWVLHDRFPEVVASLPRSALISVWVVLVLAGLGYLICKWFVPHLLSVLCKWRIRQALPVNAPLNVITEHTP